MAGLWFERFEAGQVRGPGRRLALTVADTIGSCAATCHPVTARIDTEPCRGTACGQPQLGSRFPHLTQPRRRLGLAA